MLVGGDVAQRHRLADFHRRQLAAFVVVVGGFLVAAFLVDGEKAGIDDGRAARAERRIGAAGKIDRYRIQRRVLHLAGDRALPDQLVQTWRWSS